MTWIWFQIEGQEAEIIAETCNERGIKVLEFSSPKGPKYHYLKPSSQSLGDQPPLRDPVAKKYVYLKYSEIFPLAGKTKNYPIWISLISILNSWIF